MFDAVLVQRRVDVSLESKQLYGSMPLAVRRGMRYPEWDPGEQLTVLVVGQEFARLWKWYGGDAAVRPTSARARAAKVTAGRLAALLLEARDWSNGWLAYRRGSLPSQYAAVVEASQETRFGGDASSEAFELAELRRSGPVGSRLIESCRALSKQEGGRLALYVSKHGEPHFIALGQKLEAWSRALEQTGPRHWQMEPAAYVRTIVAHFRELMGPALAEAKRRDQVLINASTSRRRAG